LPRLAGWLRSLLHRPAEDRDRCWSGVADGGDRCPEPIYGAGIFCHKHITFTRHIDTIHGGNTT